MVYRQNPITILFLNLLYTFVTFPNGEKSKGESFDFVHLLVVKLVIGLLVCSFFLPSASHIHVTQIYNVYMNALHKNIFLLLVNCLLG